MRPRYVVLAFVLLLAAAVVAMGPVRGRSVDSGVRDLADLVTSAVSGLRGDTKATDPGGKDGKQKPPEITVAQPITRNIIEWDEYSGRFDAVEAVDVRARISGYLTGG